MRRGENDVRKGEGVVAVAPDAAEGNEGASGTGETGAAAVVDSAFTGFGR